MPLAKKPLSSTRRVKVAQPFKGPIKEVKQTLDIGTGYISGLERINEQAEKFSNRKYVAVDPTYEWWHNSVNYKKQNLELNSATGLKILEKFVKEGIKVRNINIDFPDPQGKYDWVKMFNLISQVLLPGGKVYLTSENRRLIWLLNRLALRRGFSTNYDPNFKEQEPRRKYSENDFEKIRTRNTFNKNKIQYELNGRTATEFQQWVSMSVNSRKPPQNPYQLIITYPLRRAYTKEERRALNKQ